jgi:hypothetical protein
VDVRLRLRLRALGFGLYGETFALRSFVRGVSRGG